MRDVDDELVRRGFRRSSGGTASGLHWTGRCVHGLVNLMGCSAKRSNVFDDLTRCAWQSESHDSVSEDWEDEESSEDCDEATDHTDADEEDAAVASDAQYGALLGRDARKAGET